jgi:copper chaperone CopZ
MSTTTEYVVSGMTCAHCVQAVTDEGSGLSGVTYVAVYLTSGAPTVVSDADLPFDDIERAVDEAGYTVTAR